METFTWWRDLPVARTKIFLQLQSNIFTPSLPDSSCSELNELLGKWTRSLSVTRKNFGILSFSDRLHRDVPGIIARLHNVGWAAAMRSLTSRMAGDIG